MNISIKNAFLLTFCLTFTSQIFGQKVTKTTIDGKEYFVYPFSNRVNYQNNYFDAFAKDRSTIKNYYGDLSQFEEGYSKKMLRDFQRQYRKQMKEERMYQREYKNENKYLKSKKFLSAIRKNPKLFVTADYSLESDIIPSLDPIPNGKYVQFFDTMWYLLPNGKFEKKQLVSGMFTMKDNRLEGEATWFGPWGDTLKHGFYSAGVKVGEWTLISKNIDRYLSKLDVEKFIATNALSVDTATEIFTYKDGVSNGAYQRFYNSKYPVEEGFYLDNERVGTWLERSQRSSEYSSTGKNWKWDFNIVTARYTIDENMPLIKKPMIRFRQIPNIDDAIMMEDYNFDPKYYPDLSYSTLFTLQPYKKVETLNLEEEEIGSYDGGEEYYDEGEYYEEDYYEENTYEKEYYVSTSDSYVTSSKMIDSVGYYLNYAGVYEKFYPNGQLMVRYEIDNNGIKEEDTIFWDNGKAHDVIIYNQDSSQFVQSIYDYDGKLYKSLVFDSKGKFLRVGYELDLSSTVVVDGLLGKRSGPEDNFYRYDAEDTLKTTLNDSLVIYASWYQRDTALIFMESYIPKERKLNRTSYSILNQPISENELYFSENFESWTGTNNFKIGDLRNERKSSGSMDFLTMTFYHSKELFDSFPQLGVNNFSNWYDVTNDYTLFNKNEAFTGKLNFKVKESKLKLSTSKNAISLTLPKSLNTDKIKEDILKFEQTGRTKDKFLLSVVDESSLDYSYGMNLYYDLLDNALNGFASPPYSYYDEYDYEGNSRRNRGKNRDNQFTPEMTSIDGTYALGKANGVWTVKDQKNKEMVSIPFLNGEVTGTVKTYSYIQGKNPVYEYRKDTLPKKTTYYFSGSDSYKNGLHNGKSIEYNWLGEVISEFNFVDGYREGPGMERNSFAHTSMRFLNGSLDGYLRTYLTLPGKDSLQIYNLNFKNGLLQGESKAYHTNGKLAKRGFFLDGQPIDDYEAYDTLGVKYHYVKFLYSHPVEEKIWEENQLSVRYLFDWRDSIYFNAEDITTSQSLEAILYNYGLGGNQIEQPYYGRQSIIDKQGIDYHMTKYYPNDTIARDGLISSGKKAGCWKFYSYEGELLYEVDYQDTILTLNDSIQYASKGILTDFDKKGNKISESYVIEKFEKYDCSHTDHYEIRQLKTIWCNDSLNRMNGYAKNYYDNGVLQNEGQMKDGLPTGVWKFYDPYGKLNQVGEYVLGKRHGRWLAGDLEKTKFLGEICLNPNLPNLEEEMAYREKLLDILITNYKYGKALNKEYYDINMNLYDDENSEEEVIEMEEGE
ncbi:MAG: hypothetical protein V4638_01385 [Bacteroidota bacterium]